jgi:branched-chain amino acid aminotransferase
MRSASRQIVNVNGRLVPASKAVLPLFDHGLLYGDGLFETFGVSEGCFFRLERHLARLAAGAGQMRLALPASLDALTDAVRQTVRANDLVQGAVRLTVTRGAGSAVPDPDRCPAASYFIFTRPKPSAPAAPGRLCLAGRHPQLFIPGVKSLCYLPFQQARVEARGRGYDDALLPFGGHLVESSGGNLFAVRDGVLWTPPLSSGCLPGITREAVLEIAAVEGIPVEEANLTVEDLHGTQELFLTGSLQGIQPIREFEGACIGTGLPGPVTLRLRRLLAALIEAERRP